MPLKIVLDFAAAALGLLGSLILLVTAIRAAPLQKILDEIGETDTSDPGYQIGVAVRSYAQNALSKVRLWDPVFMYVGIVLLVASFGCSLVKDILEACG